MKKVLIAGAISNVGKTTVITLLIKNIKEKVAALKIVACKDPINHKCPKGKGCGVCNSLTVPFIIHKNKNIINTPNTDTNKLSKAGAKPVLWLICKTEHLEEGANRAFSSFPSNKHLFIEGNSIGKTNLINKIIMILSPDGKIKKSARDIWDKVDFFLINKNNNKTTKQILELQILPITEKKVFNLNIKNEAEDFFLTIFD